MGGRQIVLVSTAGFSVLNMGIFWREAKTKRLFSQCRCMHRWFYVQELQRDLPVPIAPTGAGGEGWPPAHSWQFMGLYCQCYWAALLVWWAKVLRLITFFPVTFFPTFSMDSIFLVIQAVLQSLKPNAHRRLKKTKNGFCECILHSILHPSKGGDSLFLQKCQNRWTPVILKKIS